jgi:ubiquitin C-terminal hydrolase
MVVHLGKTLLSGHYVAYVRNESNWYQMDDLEVM